MTDAGRPVVVAYDGSAEARAAVASAAELFGDRPLLVVSVWEPGLALAMQTHPDALGATAPPPSREEVATIDRIEAEHGDSLAQAGARLARDRGASAVAIAAPDGGSVAATLLSVAAEHDAAGVVVGSRGRGAVKSSLFGSTSRSLLSDANLPVIVVRSGDHAGGHPA
jgi:nucleotide-binding universal stress UspA family protein